MKPAIIEGYTVTKLAKFSKKSRHAVEAWLSYNDIKPVINELLYPPCTLNKLLKANVGRPTKLIKLFMGEPTEKKVDLFFNSAKAALKSFINAKNKFDIYFVLSSKKEPDKPIGAENKVYNNLTKLVKEILGKQDINNPMPIEEILKYLKRALDIKEDEELSELIKEIESSKPEPAKTSKKAKK
jgi:hypothetical protein